MNTLKTLTCPQCQQQFEFIPTNNRRKYCSNKCKRRANQIPDTAPSRQRYLASPKGKATKQRKQAKYYQSEKYKESKIFNSLKQKLKTRQNRKPCLVCMKPLPLGRHKFCSNDCRTFNQKLFKLPKIVMARKCSECHNTAYFRQQYCSYKCRLKAQYKTETNKSNRRAQNRRRRAQKRKVHNEIVYLEIVAQRDKHKCHICRKRVNMNLDVQDKYSATMDHLIPISLGGDHTYANIRLAHRTCNSRKGNRAVNEQLLLFG